MSGCNALVDVSTNLNYLRHMYTHVLGLIYQNSTDESQLDQLDLLEMIFYRLSNQMQRYLQAHNHSSGYDKYTVLPQEFSNTEIGHAILCHLRDMAKSTVRAIGPANTPLRPYQFCRSANYLTC